MDVVVRADGQRRCRVPGIRAVRGGAGSGAGDEVPEGDAAALVVPQHMDMVVGADGKRGGGVA